MVERIHYKEGEFINLELPNHGNIGVLVSGGADSALLTYLLAYYIKKNQLPVQIFPITAELLSRPYNLRYSQRVLEKISELLNFKFNLHLNFFIPNHLGEWSDEQKVAVKSYYTADFIKRYQLVFLYNALTSAPSEEDLPPGIRSESPGRTSEEWKEKQKNIDPQKVPFIDIDKRGIAELYAKFNLLESLFPLTRSCESELEETIYCTKVCSEVLPLEEYCWWCREREFAFSKFL